MFNDYQSYLIQGIASAKAGEKHQARRMLERVINFGNSLDMKIDALYWLSEISEDPQEKRDLLEEILSYRPGDGRARRKFAILKGELQEDDIIDPDRHTQTASKDPQENSAERFTCPQCGGRRVFSADGQTLICEFCEARERKQRVSENNEELAEKDFFVAMATAKGHSKPVSVHSITCQGCGAVFMIPAEQLTRACPYCNTPYALDQIETREVVAPDGVIPFQVDERAARVALRQWFKEQPLDSAPKVARGKGLYLPIWTFDIGGQIPWNCQVMTMNASKRGEKWEPKSDRWPVFHNDLIVLATRQIKPALQEFIHSYDYQKVIAFEQRYLADWMAETYQIAVGDASLQARKLALDAERDKIEHSFMMPVRNMRINSSGLTVESFKLVLIPVWMTQYEYEEQRFDILINGQTGQVFGEKPKKGLKGWLDKLLG